MHRIGRWIARQVDAVEFSSAPWWYFLFTLLSAATLRNFFEHFTDREPGVPLFGHFFELLSGITAERLPFMFIHYGLFYISLALALVIVLHLLTRHDMARLARLISSGFLILLIVPTMDYLLTGGQGYDLGYIIPADHGALLPQFLSYFGPLTGFGVSPGMRVEIAIAIASAIAFFWYRGYGIARALLAGFAVYATIFFHLATPYFTDPIYAFFGASEQYSNLAGIRYFGVLVLLQASIAAYLAWPRVTRIVIADLRYFRLAHYYAMFLLGMLLCYYAGNGSLTFNAETATIVPLMLFAVIGAWGFSVATNNVEDLEIDRVSSPDRPLVTGAVSESEYAAATWALLAMALGAGALSGFVPFFMIGVYLAAYFIYSMPPLRLKRVTYFSKLAILVNSCVLIAAGFAAFNTLHMSRVEAYFTDLLGGIPAPLLMLLPWMLVLALNFIDLKDTEGDRIAGVPTIPVLIGQRRAQLLIGASFLFLYTAVGSLLFDGPLAWGTIGLGVVQFFLINRKEYREAPVFSLYLASLAGIFSLFI